MKEIWRDTTRSLPIFSSTPTMVKLLLRLAIRFKPFWIVSWLLLKRKKPPRRRKRRRRKTSWKNKERIRFDYEKGNFESKGVYTQAVVGSTQDLYTVYNERSTQVAYDSVKDHINCSIQEKLLRRMHTKNVNIVMNTNYRCCTLVILSSCSQVVKFYMYHVITLWNTELRQLVIRIGKVIGVRKAMRSSSARRFVMNGCPHEAIGLTGRHRRPHSKGHPMYPGPREAFQKLPSLACGRHVSHAMCCVEGHARIRMVFLLCATR
mmetsp:Transcript_9087/g.15156  ORF Transcript_9087/g.15156 Transcript_9087/m.15156 type:complete len:263 (-) Transcript_9087:1516-2304(-)